MIIKVMTSEDIAAVTPALIDLLRDVVNGGASVNFIAPLAQDIAERYWHRVAGEVERGERIVLIAVEEGGDGTLVGCVHLVPALTPNGIHRAEVQKVLVHSQYRRRGIGKALLLAAEEQARRMGRKLLVLDTERDSSGERLYTSCGWQRAGVIPNFALNHDGTQYVDTVYYYKLLGE